MSEACTLSICVFVCNISAVAGTKTVSSTIEVTNEPCKSEYSDINSPESQKLVNRMVNQASMNLVSQAGMSLFNFNVLKMILVACVTV